MIELRPYSSEYDSQLLGWFDDPETVKWLGDRSWVDNIHRLQSEPAGTEFRGIKKIAYFPYLAFHDDELVGFIDGGIGDKYIEYSRDENGVETYQNEQAVKSSAIAFVVAPQARNKGYASEMIREYVKLPELREVGIFYAGVEPENTASRRALEKAGFKTTGTPDFEGMLYYFIYRQPAGSQVRVPYSR